METTILLLISEPLVRQVTREVLERAGYLVMATGDLGTAVDRYEECKPDLLMISPYVETITGHEAAKYLQWALSGHAHSDGGGSAGRRSFAESGGAGASGNFPKAVHRPGAVAEGEAGLGRLRAYGIWGLALSRIFATQPACGRPLTGERLQFPVHVVLHASNFRVQVIQQKICSAPIAVVRETNAAGVDDRHFCDA